MLKTLIIIPAYNEEKNIDRVIESLHNQNSSWTLLVINDGSSDQTSKIARLSQKAQVIDLPANLGIGGGVQTGFKYAQYYGFDNCVQFDGDGQHLASEIPKLLEQLEYKQCDVVIGSRFKEKNEGFQSTPLRRMGIKIFEWVNSILISQKITDNTSGFRAYNSEAIAFLARFYPTDYPEPEAVILLGKNGFKLNEISVLMLERQGGVSSISGLKSAYYMIKVLFAIAMTFSRKRIRPIQIHEAKS
jgi:glycosyltransferase involved in cell wall biosynthesis